MKRTIKLIGTVVLTCAIAVACAADQRGWFWFDLAALPTPCVAGRVMGTSSGAGWVCDDEGDWRRIAAFYEKALPACSAFTQSRLEVDASGDLCFCDGTTWNLLVGTACVEETLSYILREDAGHILREDSGKIVRE